MRRLLLLLCLLVALAGLELVTGVGLSALQRLRAGFMALATGSPYQLSRTRLAAGFGLMILGAFSMTALTVLGLASGRIRADGKLCPDCGAMTKRVHRRVAHRILGALLQRNIVRRRCEFCGWVGLARR